MEDIAVTTRQAVIVVAEYSPPSGAPRPLRLLYGVSWRSLALPALAFLSVAGYFALRSLTVVVPEGDSALHLQLMQRIAGGDLPKTVPYFAAVVGEGGRIEAYFPYSYTPLYHLFGAALYKVGGERLVLMMGPVFSGVIAVCVVKLLRGNWPVVAVALPLIFLHWLTQPILTWIYMEPMMLAFFFGGLCFYQRGWSGGSNRDFVMAGALFGLAIAARQSALLYVAFVAVHGGATLILDGRDGRRQRKVAGLALRYAAMAAACLLVALPFLAYLVWSSGTVGYGEFAPPGMSSSLSIDSVANGYLSDISMPPGNTLDWLHRFWEWTLFTPRWQVAPVAYLPLLPFIVGIAYLWQREDRASRFLATYVPVHILGEMGQFTALHGNWRYIIASRMLFYAVVAVGICAIARWMYRSARAGDSWNPKLAGACAAALTMAAMAPAFVTPGLIDFLAHQGEARADKARSFESLGAFVQKQVPEDALLLSGRWYTSGYYLQRNYTWMTYFGNAWVIDAISTPSPAQTRAVLERYGVDYVVIQAPPPTYIDQMPNDGLRRVVLDDLGHFQLVFNNGRTRLYRFWPLGIERPVDLSAFAR